MTQRAPLITPVRGAVNLTNMSFVMAAPLVLLLTNPIGLPVQSFDWPNPIIRKDLRASWLPFEQNLQTTTLARVPQLLQGISDDRIYPRVTSRAPFDLVQTPTLQLLSSVVISQPVGDQLMIDIPALPNRVALFPFYVNLLESTLIAPAVLPPVGKFLEPRYPAAYPLAALAYVHVNLTNSALTSSVADRFSSTYWGHQYSPLPQVQDFTPQNLILRGITAGITPFTALDFPNPVILKPTIYADSKGSTNLLAGFVIANTPFTAKDFPNPTLREPTIFSDSFGSTNLLAGIPLGVAPFKPKDFANPLLRPSRPPDTSNVSFALMKTPPVAPFGKSTNTVPTPLRYIPSAVYFEGENAFLPTPTPILPGIASGPGQYGDRVILPAKKLGETVIIPGLDFISKLSAGETIVSAVCTCSVYTGSDPNPSAMIVGLPTVSGTIVNQLVTGGVLGTIYEFLAKVVTSLGQTLELTGFLAVVPDLP